MILFQKIICFAVLVPLLTAIFRMNGYIYLHTLRQCAGKTRIDFHKLAFDEWLLQSLGTVVFG